MPDSIIKTNNLTTLNGLQGPGVPDGSPLLPGFNFSNDTDSGLYRISENKIGITAGGVKVGEFGSGYGGFTGNVIQVAYAELTTSGASSNVQIPLDTTIPQQTEGVEILTCSITPKYANSFLFIDSVAFVGENTNVSDAIAVALFRDSGLDALSVSINNGRPAESSPFGGATHFNPIYLFDRILAGSTSPTTFKIRAGGNGSGSIRWNGANGSQFFNGTLITYIRIMEVQA